MSEEKAKREMKELDDFVSTLPPDIQEKVASNKTLGTIRKLERLGIDIPRDVIVAFEERQARYSDHDFIMDSMRPFAGNKLEDLSDLLARL